MSVTPSHVVAAASRALPAILSLPVIHGKESPRPAMRAHQRAPPTLLSHAAGDRPLDQHILAQTRMPNLPPPTLSQPCR